MRCITSLFLSFLLASCGPSYPKERVAESLVELCHKEHGIDVKAQVAKTTLGVLVVIPGLIDELMRQAAGSPGEPPPPLLVEGEYRQDRFDFQFLSRGSFSRVTKEADLTETDSRAPDREKSHPLKMLDQVSTAIRRVALSTDAPLEFYTLIARDPGSANLDVVFSGHLNDLKRVMYFDISIGEAHRRSRFSLRHQPETIARQTVQGFLRDLPRLPLPQLLGSYTAGPKNLRELFPRILQLAVDLQGQEKNLILMEKEWPVRQIRLDQVLVYVPLSAAGLSGAVLFTVQLKEGQGTLSDIERLEGPDLPARVRSLGPPSQWKGTFYLEPIFLPQFLSEQIAKRVLGEFEPLDNDSKKENDNKDKKKPATSPATTEEVTRALLETSAYVLSSYRFTDFKELTVTDALKGTRWSIPSKDLPLYRRRSTPNLQPLP